MPFQNCGLIKFLAMPQLAVCKSVTYYGIICRKAEPVFVNVYGARNRFRGIDAASLCCLAGQYNI
jgi:hypothetical protein